MKDPREYRNWSGWYVEATEQSRKKHEPHHLALLHSDVCRRLDAKDAEIAALRQRQIEIEALIAAFVAPHEALDDEATDGEQYDDLIASWTLSLTELRAYYHDHIICTQASKEGEG